MRYVADTNTFLAVALNRPERTWLLDVTAGCDLIAPAVLPYEVGNALSAMAKRRALTPERVEGVLNTVAEIPVELVEVDVRAALLLAVAAGIYAYDAYFLQCALQTGCPLLTLDRGLRRTANGMDIKSVVRS